MDDIDLARKQKGAKWLAPWGLQVGYYPLADFGTLKQQS